MDLEVQILTSLDELEAIGPAWAALVAQSSSATVFSTWEWLAPWWRAFGRDMRLLALVFLDPTATVVGLAFLEATRRTLAPGVHLRVLRMMGDGTGDSDHLDFPVIPGYETAVAHALLRELSQRRRQWDVCELNTLPANSAVGNVLLSMAQEPGWSHAVFRRPGASVLLPDDWHAYLSLVSKKERNKLGYYMRRLEKKYDVRVSKCTSHADLPAWLEDLYRLHQKRWALRGEPGSFGAAPRRQFYLEMAGALLARNSLEFWRLRVNGLTVATQFGFRYGPAVFSLQEGFDPDYYPDRVGYLLRGSVLKELIASGVQRYDFLAGEDTSKERWGTHPTPYVDLHFARAFSLGSAYLTGVDRAGAAKEWLRAHVPGSVWAALRRSYHLLGVVGKAHPPIG